VNVGNCFSEHTVRSKLGIVLIRFHKATTTLNIVP
jgi:hypothetical protein